MQTLIFARGVFEVAETDRPIPLKPDYSVDYDEYIKRINKNTPVKIDRNLCEII